MRFERYPLDEHICKFRVGSTNMDINYMKFGETTLGYDDSSRTTVLEYAVVAKKLQQEDRIIQYAGQNYSVTGKRDNLLLSQVSCTCIFIVLPYIFFTTNGPPFSGEM